MPSTLALNKYFILNGSLQFVLREVGLRTFLILMCSNELISVLLTSDQWFNFWSPSSYKCLNSKQWTFEGGWTSLLCYSSLISCLCLHRSGSVRRVVAYVTAASADSATAAARQAFCFRWHSTTASPMCIPISQGVCPDFGMTCLVVI